MKIFAAVGNHAGFIPAYGESVVPSDRDIPHGFWYEIPDSSIIRSGNPFFVPDFDTRFVALPSIAVRICKLGKGIAPRFVPRYYDEVTFGLSVVAADRLGDSMVRGLPWTPAVAFDGSCMLGRFIPTEECGGKFLIKAGGNEVAWSLDSACRHIGEIISEISRGCTIKTGDIILPYISSAGIRLLPGDHISVMTTDSSNILEINVK